MKRKPHPDPLLGKEREELQPHPDPLLRKERGKLQPHPCPLLARRGGMEAGENYDFEGLTHGAIPHKLNIRLE